MAKDKIKYVCSSCEYETTKWLGKCPNCGDWATFVEKTEDSKQIERLLKQEKLEKSNLYDLEIEKEYRYKTSFKEFDNILGGGLVKGEVVLITGNPGIGKSTILLQIANEYAKKDKVFYISGEESIKQIKERAVRIGIKNKYLYLLNSSSIEIILNEVEKEKPNVVVIDSIQTMYSSEVTSVPGSVSQIKEVCFQIIELAKKYEISFYIVGHITKDGKLAGPKMLEHMVDACMQIEGDEKNFYRIIRSSKNRFGSTNEIAIFNMKETGMEEVKNPSEFFLSEREEKNIGSIVVASMEGTKPMLFEIQSLITNNSYGIPKRIIQGLDRNRIELLLAIISRYLDVDLINKDIYVNVPGGMNVDDRATDLGIVLSLISSYFKREISQKIAALGEIGLRGEVRKISFLKKRIKELEKLGFTGIYVPKQQMEELKKEKLNIGLNYINNISELLERSEK